MAVSGNPWYCYLLVSSRPPPTRSGRRRQCSTYIGATTCVPRRLRQHNGELRGGARHTHKFRPWTLLANVTVGDKIEALRLEWRLKRARGVKGRLKHFKKLCELRGFSYEVHFDPDEL